MLTNLITQTHAESNGTYGIERVHAELTLGRGVKVGFHQVHLPMQRAEVQGVMAAENGDGSSPTTSPATSSNATLRAMARTTRGSPTSPN
ncbi:hypothetical protein GCM10010467_15000 [Actinocorallia glomerata]|uniref:Uncharacterized protein n=2 Tax=Actinomycetes TaxID=1760 RepID=A0ABP6M3B4_9MICC